MSHGERAEHAVGRAHRIAAQRSGTRVDGVRRDTRRTPYRRSNLWQEERWKTTSTNDRGLLGEVDPERLWHFVYVYVTRRARGYTDSEAFAYAKIKQKEALRGD